MKLLLALPILLASFSASAVTFVCQNPDGKASIPGAAIVEKSDFMGTPNFTIFFPRTLEGRDFSYSKLIVGTDKENISIEPWKHDGAFLHRPKYFYIVVDAVTSKAPMTFSAYYGMDKCQTVTKVALQ
jgi:hypothetical protein